ncbi:LytTR family DNA-binding domain-containing protein [Spirosoma taeanense]|uniref:LytTR family DNA-binding domain-containing protein n=1 Tax=Spirosoma taeanense TaxID=2735870 RepID=UPI001F035119|nr:LytTR family DNA-binding domain-containing protein [Spirosoma taeanense]
MLIRRFCPTGGWPYCRGPGRKGRNPCIQWGSSLYSLNHRTDRSGIGWQIRDNYLKIHLCERELLVVRLTMKAMLDKLPAESFIRVNRSYKVFTGKIQALRSRMILVGDEEIPIGSSYEKEFCSLFRR